NGGAVKNACEQIRDRLAAVAASLIGTNPSDVRFSDGTISGLGAGAPKLSWEEVVHAAYFQRVQLSASGYYRTEGLHWDAKAMQGEPFK
ncbi:molybdopterin cofactor-binding domain-containing protein, partial [Mycobacterium kansasii]